MLDKPKVGGYEAKFWEQVEDDKMSLIAFIEWKISKSYQSICYFSKGFWSYQTGNPDVHTQFPTGKTGNRWSLQKFLILLPWLGILKYLLNRNFWKDDSVQKLVEEAMPDLDVGLVMNEWTDCKVLLSGTSNLDSYSFAELVSLFQRLGRKAYYKLLIYLCYWLEFLSCHLTACLLSLQYLRTLWSRMTIEHLVTGRQWMHTWFTWTCL